jgi:zinc transporter
MLDKAEDNGLVCAYQVDETGQMKELAWADMDAALATEDNVVWLHFNQADPRARDWITSTTYLPAAGKAILLGTDTHMRIEVCGNGLAGIVGDLHHEFAQKSDRLDVLRIYLNNHCLISARCEPLNAIEKLRRSIGDGLKVERPVTIIAQFLHHVTDTLNDLLTELTGNVDDLEDQLLAGQISDRQPELARIRRIAARLRRHMVPQQHALVTLLTRLPTWVDEAGAAALRHAIERLAALGHDLDLVQERARLVGDQLSGRLMEATNRNLYVLSIVTTIFLPMTLVTGIFGMNLGGLPAQQDPFGFWYGIVGMILLGVVTWWLLRRAKLM